MRARIARGFAGGTRRGLKLETDFMAVISRADPFDLVCRICGCRLPPKPHTLRLSFNSLVMRPSTPKGYATAPKGKQIEQGGREGGAGGSELKVYLKGQCHMFGVLCVF